MKVLSYRELRPQKGIAYSRAHLGRLIDERKFPAPIKLGENRVAFVESEIDEWIEARMRERGTKRVRCPGPKK